MRSAVIQFPGSNCERDAYTVLAAEGLNPQMVWHQETSLPEDTALIVVPGGFTYGDYLRCGAMAAHAPIMQEVRRFAERGGYVLGICNGFQILCEAGMLPGTLMKNQQLTFVCKTVHCRVEQPGNPFFSSYEQGQVIELPIAHHEGNYRTDADTLAQLQQRGQILLRYCDEEGALHEDANPNGSLDAIAGISNEAGNVVGMMPHPERHAEALLGGVDGVLLFTSIQSRMC